MNIRPLIAAIALACLAGCGALTTPQKGGGASVSPSASKSFNGQISPPSEGSLGMPAATITQPDNPNSNSSQDVKYEYEEVITTPIDTVKETTTSYPDGHQVVVREPVPAGTKIIRKSKSAVNQQVGGSWKDTARELTAALSSFQVVQYAGIALLLAGAVCFFHPVLRTIVGGKDVALAVAGSGVVMMFGPFLFVQYSRYFFLAIILAGGYWLIARFKYQHGQLDTIKSQLTL